MTENKRKHSRINSLNLLHIGVYKNDLLIKQAIGRTINVSEEGILLETYFFIKPESNVLLSVGLKDYLLEIKGKALHATQDTDNKYKIGIKFNTISQSDLEILKKYINDITDKHD